MPLPVVRAPSGPYKPIVLALEALIDVLGGQTLLDQAVQAARAPPMNTLLDLYGIKDGPSFYAFANDLLYWTPTENMNSQDVLDVLCAFYFVLDQPPLGDKQTPILPASVGKPLTPLSDWVKAFAIQIGGWMSDSESLNAKTYATFKTATKYRADEWLIPDPSSPTGGFTCFNDFFARHLIPGVRPVASPNDDTVAVFPADSQFDMSCPVDSDATITVKGIPWKIPDLLQGSTYQNEFAGGTFMHSFLDTFNYHRQHTPVSGTVVEARVIQGAAYLEVDKTPDGKLVKRRRLAPAPFDGVFPDATSSTVNPDAVDGTGYQFIQMRGLFVIDSPELGLVAVLPIGMAHVSSIVPVASVGDKLNKGDEISYFQFGGSDIIVVFQEKAGVPGNFSPPPAPADRGYNLVNSLLVQGKPQSKRSNGY